MSSPLPAQQRRSILRCRRRHTKTRIMRRAQDVVILHAARQEMNMSPITRESFERSNLTEVRGVPTLNVSTMLLQKMRYALCRFGGMISISLSSEQRGEKVPKIAPALRLIA